MVSYFLTGFAKGSSRLGLPFDLGIAMADLSERHIECLVELVEDKLVRMSTDMQEQSADYRDLQNCRYALIAMAASANVANMSPQARSDFRSKTSHLRAISGGKQ